MREQRLQNEIIACLADGHWWTAGELADTVEEAGWLVQNELDDLLRRGFVELFDREDPPMYGWTVEPKAVERERENADV